MILLAILANVALESFKAWLAPKMDAYEEARVSSYAEKIKNGEIKYEEYTICKGDTVDGIIYNHIDTSNTDKNLEDIRDDIEKINMAVRGEYSAYLIEGNTFLVPVY